MSVTRAPSFTHPFENDNAKYLNPEEVAKTFVPIELYWTLFSEKNHVVLGTRGSGKTAVARMLSHDHLRHLDHPAARAIVSEKRFIGCYAPARLNWVTGLRSQSLARSASDRDYFTLRFNFVVAQAFLNSLSSLLYVFGAAERAETEHSLVQRILGTWCPGVVPMDPIYTIKDLNARLSEVDFRLQRVNAGSLYGSKAIASEFDHEIATSFSTGLCAPVFVLRAAALAAFDLTEQTKFLITIDEMEFLNEDHHRILNGLMRADTPGFVFKFVTAPYCHYTLQTETKAPLIEGNDFEYVHMDHNRNVDRRAVGVDLTGVDRRFHFATALFLKRAQASGLNVDSGMLERLLGPSPVLDPVSFSQAQLEETAWRYIRHANLATQERIYKRLVSPRQTKSSAARGVSRKQMSDELFRKMKPAVLLRELVKEAVGATKLTAYSGLAMVIGCTDSNPRLLIRTYKMMFPDLERRVLENNPMVPPARQNEIMETISQRFWDTIYAVPDVGPKLAEMVGKIGEHFYRRLHVEDIGTDIPGSVEVESADVELSHMVRQAVAWGFMYPHFKDEHRSALPASGGEFRLSYTLAPKFRILPRRGRVVKLSSMFPQRRLL